MKTSSAIDKKVHAESVVEFPEVYADYLVADFTRLEEGMQARVRAVRPNLLATVAALGFGDIPSRAFVAAWNLTETPSWVMFNIKEDFLSPQYQYGFSWLVRRLKDEGLLEVRVQQAYRHRLAIDGRPLHYLAFIGVKTRPIPEAWLAGLD